MKQEIIYIWSECFVKFSILVYEISFDKHRSLKNGQQYRSDCGFQQFATVEK